MCLGQWYSTPAVHWDHLGNFEKNVYPGLASPKPVGSEFLGCDLNIIMASQVVLVVKNAPTNAGDLRRHGFDPWVGKIPWRRK